MEGQIPHIVGREDELKQLVAAIEADRSIAVIGEAGIGKTSLVRAAAGSSGRRLNEGGGFFTLRDVPLLALRRALNMPLADDPSEVAGQVERRVGPDLLFMDDLHWIDTITARTLPLLRGRIMLVVGIRTGDPGTAQAMALARDLDLEMLTLTSLDDDAARAIVTATQPGLGAVDLNRVVARGGGNPLVLREVASRGEPSLVLARSIHAGVRDLSPAGRDLLELLAVIDRPVNLVQPREAVDEVLAAGFIVARDGHLEIRHVLIAEAIRAELDEARRRVLHERAAAAATDAAEVARHLVNAGLRDRAATVARSALKATINPVARAELLVVVAAAAGPDAGPSSRIEAAAALSAVSDWNGVVQLLEPGEPLGPSRERVLRDAFLAHALFSLGRHEAARSVLDRGAGQAMDPGDPAAAQLAIERAAFMVNVDGRLHDAIDGLTTLLEAHPPEAPSHHAVRAIVESIRMLAAQPVDIDYLRAAAEGAFAAGQFASAADLARVVTFAMLMWRGALDALAYLEEVGVRLATAGAHSASLECLADAVQASILAGRPADAVTRADELLEQPAPPRARQTAMIFRARALGLLGLVDEAGRSLAEIEPTISDDYVGRGELMRAEADLALWGGRTGHAIERAERVIRTPSPALGAHALPELTRAWAQYDSGMAPGPVADAAPTPAQAGAPPESEGLGRLHAGDAIGAAERFAVAASGWAGFNAPRELMCRWAEGEALRQAGEIEAAIQRLEAVLDAAMDGEFEMVAVRIRRSLRRAGRRLPASGPTPRANGIGLTRRERELLELVGQGMTNAEIARRMGLGRPTVARILSNAMGKLGAETRGQAVRIVAARL